MFGFSKDFVIFLFIASAFAYGFKDWKVGLYILVWYAIIKMIWRLLTR